MLHNNIDDKYNPWRLCTWCHGMLPATRVPAHRVCRPLSSLSLYTCS